MTIITQQKDYNKLSRGTTLTLILSFLLLILASIISMIVIQAVNHDKIIKLLSPVTVKVDNSMNNMDKFAIAAIQGTTLIEPMTNQEVNTVVENAYRIAKRMEEYRIDLTSKTVINTPINNTTQHNNNTKGVK